MIKEKFKVERLKFNDVTLNASRYMTIIFLPLTM